MTMINRDAVIAAIEGEKLTGDTGHESDIAYNDALADAIAAVKALPGVSSAILDIEEAKKQEYVLAKVSHDAANYGGRWFVVRYIGEGDWSLHPGYGVGDDYFSAFMPLPSPPEGE
jgi:hypothetical protein